MNIADDKYREYQQRLEMGMTALEEALEILEVHASDEGREYEIARLEISLDILDVLRVDKQLEIERIAEHMAGAIEISELDEDEDDYEDDEPDDAENYDDLEEVSQ